MNNKDMLKKLLDISKMENVSKIIIGYPLNFNSEKTIQTHKVEKFKEQLETFLKNKMPDIEIIFYDERLTSKLAEASMRDSGMKKSKRREKGLIDSMSAQIILQDFLDQLNNRSL